MEPVEEKIDIKIIIKPISVYALMANYFLYFAGLFAILHSVYGVSLNVLDMNKHHTEYFILEGFIIGTVSMFTSEGVVNGKKISNKR